MTLGRMKLLMAKRGIGSAAVSRERALPRGAGATEILSLAGHAAKAAMLPTTENLQNKPPMAVLTAGHHPVQNETASWAILARTYSSNL